MSIYLAKPQRFLVRPAPGWKELTLDEVLRILSTPLQKYKFEPKAILEDGVVVVSDCDYRQALELVARVTTVHDIDWVIQSGRVSSRSEWKPFLEKSGVGQLWDDPQAFTFHVSAMVSHPVVGTEKEIKDLARAIWPFCSDHESEESDGDIERPLQRIRIESSKNRHRVLISLGGAPLYRRGYKVKGLSATAPIPEHHASSCFLYAVQSLQGIAGELKTLNPWTVLTPFAGTGTTAFEAIARILDVAPALTRSFYACEGFAFHPSATMGSIRQRLRKSIGEKSKRLNLIFGDLNEAVVQDLRLQTENFFRLAGASVTNEIRCNDFLSNPEELMSFVPAGDFVFLPLNPPYGNRLAKGSGGEIIYKRLGEALRSCAKLAVIAGYIICPDEVTWGHVQRILKGFDLVTTHFSHGGLDARLLAFSSLKNQ